MINNELIQPFNPFEGAWKPFPEEEFNNIKKQIEDEADIDILNKKLSRY